MPCAAAISEHPVTAHAVGEVVGQVLESLAVEPDLVFLFVTQPHAGALEDAAKAVLATLGPRVLLGCAAESVIGPRTEVEGTAAVSLWAGGSFAVAPLAVPARGLREGHDGLDQLDFVPGALILLADPYSVDAERLLRWVDERFPGLPVVGGMASAAQGPGGNRLALGPLIRSGGAVGALIGTEAGLTPLVSQGCRLVGRPWAVTRAEGNVIYELAGRPALERLIELAKNGLDTNDVDLVNRGGLHLGVVVDEHQAEFGPGDFLVHNVLGGDRGVGAIAVDTEVEVGTTVQYQLRDAAAADEDLKALATRGQADGAVLFTGSGQGVRLFGQRHHDASVLGDLLHDVPLAGMFSAGEFGPLGGRNFCHRFTAAAALFGSTAGG